MVSFFFTHHASRITCFPRAQRQAQADDNSTSRRVGDFTMSADLGHSLVQIVQAVAAAGLVHRRWQAASVVFDADEQTVFFLENYFDADFGRAGMSGDVGERFLERQEKIVPLL